MGFFRLEIDRPIIAKTRLQWATGTKKEKEKTTQDLSTMQGKCFCVPSVKTV